MPACMRNDISNTMASGMSISRATCESASAGDISGGKICVTDNHLRVFRRMTAMECAPETLSPGKH